MGALAFKDDPRLAKHHHDYRLPFRLRASTASIITNGLPSRSLGAANISRYTVSSRKVTVNVSLKLIDDFENCSYILCEVNDRTRDIYVSCELQGGQLCPEVIAFTLDADRNEKFTPVQNWIAIRMWGTEKQG